MNIPSPVINLAYAVELAFGGTYCIIMYRRWKSLVKAAQERLEDVETLQKEVLGHLMEARTLLDMMRGGNVGSVGINWERSPTDPNMLICLGHPIAIRDTAIGKPHRLLHHGQEVGAFDEMPDALAAGMDLLVETFRKEVEGGASPEDIFKAWAPEVSK